MLKTQCENVSESLQSPLCSRQLRQFGLRKWKLENRRLSVVIHCSLVDLVDPRTILYLKTSWGWISDGPRFQVQIVCLFLDVLVRMTWMNFIDVGSEDQKLFFLSVRRQLKGKLRPRHQRNQRPSNFISSEDSAVTCYEYFPDGFDNVASEPYKMYKALGKQ